MQVGIDVTYMHTNFGGRDLFVFGDIGTLKNGQISLLGHGLQSTGISSHIISILFHLLFININLLLTISAVY